MKLLDRILVATDFGLAAEDAVRMASWSACRFESKVDLLHVRPSESTAGASSELDQAVSARLDAIAEHMVEQGVRQVESVVLDGTEFDVIVRYAEQQSVNVIVVGAGEKTPGSPHVFLGTTAARLRRWASQPVWIVKPGEAPPIRRIFCPVDLAPDSARAMRNAIHFARAFGAELTIMTAVPPSQGDSGELRGEYADTPPESREPRLPELDSFLAKFDFHNVRSAKLIRQGKPRYEVARAAREIGADLIVMGSAGRTGLPRMLVGGVAPRGSRIALFDRHRPLAGTDSIVGRPRSAVAGRRVLLIPSVGAILRSLSIWPEDVGTRPGRRGGAALSDLRGRILSVRQRLAAARRGEPSRRPARGCRAVRKERRGSLAPPGEPAD